MILFAVIIVALASGIAAYFLLGGQEQVSETIKIGVCADLDAAGGKSIYQEAVLAVEHVNAEGGVLGRFFEVVAEDDDSESANMDIEFATNALTRLITVDHADCIISMGTFSSIYQELTSQHKKIMLDVYNAQDESTQKVLDDYDRYKYYFRVGIGNITSIQEDVVDDIVTIGEYTGFSKVAIASHDLGTAGKDWLSKLVASLSEFDMDVVYTATIPLDAIDFSSFFAQAEAAGAEIMQTPNIMPQYSAAFVREYHDRQSPMVLLGAINGGARSSFWEVTEGKCEYVSVITFPTNIGYPLTNKTLAFVEAYRQRWGDIIPSGAVYDAIRYIFPDAIRRAGVFETDVVISALETVDLETSLARRFMFTSSHDIVVAEDYFLVMTAQWQDGNLVPVLPKEIMEEAGATYLYPPWSGPWD